MRSTPIPTATIRDTARAQHIILHRLRQIGFHDRHMFMRGGVEDHLGMKRLEDLIHAHVVGDGADGDMQPVAHAGIDGGKFLVDEVQRIFPMPEQHQRRGFKVHTWRQSSAPIEPPAPVISTRFPFSELPTSAKLVLNGRPAQQIFHADLFQMRERLVPCKAACKSGNTFTVTFWRRQASTYSRMEAPLASGMAINTSSTSPRASNSYRRWYGPITRTPRI